LCRLRSVSLLSPFFVALPVLADGKTGRRHRPNGMKVHLASWRHSADTAINACRSKVIDRRFYDADA
jgi:hypothetical protein